MNIFHYLTQDWERNKGYSKGKMLMFFFRLAHCATRNRFSKLLLLPFLAFYKFWVEWILGTEIPYQTKIGKGLVVYHTVGLVINRYTVIGKNCLLRHSTTIGNNGDIIADCPVIGDNVNVGAQVCILGKVRIGDNVKIGAGSVVTKDIPPNSVVVGNPARVIKTIIN